MGIEEYAKTARKRGAEKISRVAALVYRVGFSDRHIIAQAAGDDLKYASRLVKKGVLKKVSQEGHRDAFVLTEVGLTLALDRLAGLIHQTGEEIHYPYLDGRVPWSMFQHECAVQQVLISLGCHKNVDGIGWQASRELRGRVRPDAIFAIFHPDGRDEKIWIEIERTTKNPLARALQIWDRLQAVKNGECSRILWVTEGRGVELALRRALEKRVAPKAFRCDQSRIHLLPDAAESLKPLRDASIVVPMWELADAGMDLLVD